MQPSQQREIHASASRKTMLLDFGPEIRSWCRLEVGRIARLTCCYDAPQSSIVLNWCFIRESFLVTTLASKNDPIRRSNLLPTCINFEFESLFSTTWHKSMQVQLHYFETHIQKFKLWQLWATDVFDWKRRGLQIGSASTCRIRKPSMLLIRFLT